MASPGPRSVVRFHPRPVATTGRCQQRSLTLKLNPRAARFRELPECADAASRRVVVRGDVVADVCLWHSLTATERLGAHLVRSP